MLRSSSKAAASFCRLPFASLSAPPNPPNDNNSNPKTPNDNNSEKYGKLTGEALESDIVNRIALSEHAIVRGRVKGEGGGGKFFFFLEYNKEGWKYY